MDAQTFYKQTANNIAGYLLQELDIRPGVHWQVRNATSGPRVLALALDINPRYASRIAGMAEALSMAARLDRGQNIRVSRGNRGALAIEIPKPQALWYNVSVSALPRRRGLLATVGIDNDRQLARVNFGDPLTPHCLLAGATGSGKTNAARLFIYTLALGNAPHQVSFILVDTKKRGRCWLDFAGIPHLAHPVVTDEETALRALSWAVAEVDRRAISGQTKPHVFIGIDEAQDLLDKREFVAPIGDLAATGREFGIHLLAALQNPTAAQLGDTSIKRNLTCRLVGKVDSPTAAHVATGQKETGAETLAGAGDMLLVDPTGITRLTAALLTTRDTDRLPRAENGHTLDLGEYDDVNHVLAQADNESKAGRPTDPLEAAHVALALSDPDVSQRELNRRFSVGFAKARRVLEFAAELRAELLDLGCKVICNEIPQRNRIIALGSVTGQKAMF